MPAIDIIDPLKIEEWDRFVLDRTRYSFFHSTAWASTLTSSYGYTPRYFVLRDQSGLQAALPVMEVRSLLTGRRGVSLPFTDKCPALSESEDQRNRLIQDAIRHGKKERWRYLELRDSGFANHVQPSAEYAEHILPLSPDTEGLFAGLKASVRRAIRKSEKDGVTVSVDDSFDALHGFYNLNCVTRRDHGLPPQPFLFFRRLHRHAISRRQGMVVTASHQGKPVSAALFLHFGKKAIYKYGASDKRYQTFRGNDAVMWAGIEWYARRGYESLSLGKTRTDHSGLLRFKRGWGGEESGIRYARYDFEKGAFVRGDDHVHGWHNVFFRTLPVPIARLMGAALYRHVA